MLGRADLTLSPSSPFLLVDKETSQALSEALGSLRSLEIKRGNGTEQREERPIPRWEKVFVPCYILSFFEVKCFSFVLWPGAWGFRRACNDEAPLWGWGWPFPGSQRKKSLCDRNEMDLLSAM